MTTRQITLVKNAVKKAYKERFEKDWNRKTTFLKKIQLHCLSVTSDGCLRVSKLIMENCRSVSSAWF